MSVIKLSIIVPVYNVENYLEKCLSSLCGLDIENEIIVVNDGTEDSSLEIAQRFKESHRDENIVIISQKNQGLSCARNRGLEAAQGEYISFIDSDDFVDTGSYESFIREAMQDGVDIGIGRYKRIVEEKGEEGSVLKCVTEIRDYAKGEIMTGREYFKLLYKNDMHGAEVWDDVFRRDFLQGNRILFKEGRMHEDEIFTVETLLRAQKVRFYGIYYYNYLQRESSIMAVRSLKNYSDMEKNINEIYGLMLKETDPEMKKVLESEIHRLYKIIIRHTERTYAKENKEFRKNYRKLVHSFRENRLRKMVQRFKKSIGKKLKKIKL